MTKKKVLLASLIGVIISYILANPLSFGLCRDTYIFADRLGCLDKTGPMVGLIIGLFSLPIFLLSLITYKMQDEVFRAWIRFAYWWIPLSVVVIFLAASSGGGSWGIPNIFDQETVSFILSGLFALVSLLIILWKHFGHKSTTRTVP